MKTPYVHEPFMYTSKKTYTRKNGTYLRKKGSLYIGNDVCTRTLSVHIIKDIFTQKWKVYTQKEICIHEKRPINMKKDLCT